MDQAGWSRVEALSYRSREPSARRNRFAAEAEAGFGRCTVQSTMHRRFSGCEGYRFLPPFFFAPLAAFFAIVVYPPFHSWDSARAGLSLHCSAAAIRRAGLLLSAPRRFSAGTSA